MSPRTLIAAALVAASACGGGLAPAPGAQGPGEQPMVRERAVPARIAGLGSALEDISTQVDEAAERSFITDLRMWSLREGKRLRATVEVGRFTEDARPESEQFRRSMAAQLGSAQARLRRIGRDLVFVAPGNSQTLFLWFRGEHFVLLSVSTDYQRPRSLARAVLRRVEP